MKKRWVTKKEFADIEGLSARYVWGQLQKANLQIKNGKIDYDQAKCWWDATIQKKHRNKKYQLRDQGQNKRSEAPHRLPLGSNEPIPSTADSISRKEAAVARIKELEAQEKEGELINKQVVIKTVFQVGRQARDIFLAIPRRVSGTLAMETDQRLIQQMLEEEIERGLTMFEKLKL